MVPIDRKFLWRPNIENTEMKAFTLYFFNGTIGKKWESHTDSSALALRHQCLVQYAVCALCIVKDARNLDIPFCMTCKNLRL